MASSYMLQKGLSAGVIAVDFFLAGNAMTQSTMTLPSLIASFPSPTTSPTDHAYRSKLLGTQWPICWQVGNVVMRPLSTLSTLSYAFLAGSISYGIGKANQDWRAFAFAALLHVTVIVHSAVNLQPINDKLAALAGRQSDGSEDKKGDGPRPTKDAEGGDDAVALATKWIRFNYYRALVPMVSGSIALWQCLA